MTSQDRIASIGVDEILINAARGITAAQRAMDASSLASAVELHESGLDAQLGIKSSWYAIPEVDLNLRLAFDVASDGGVKTELVDADYQQRYGFDIRASSDLHTKFVAVPPPAGRGISLLDKAEVLRRVGKIKAVVEAWVHADAPRFVTRFQAFAPQGYDGGVWQVLLVDHVLSGATRVRAWVALDDAGGDVLRLWSEPQESSP